MRVTGESAKPRDWLRATTKHNSDKMKVYSSTLLTFTSIAIIAAKLVSGQHLHRINHASRVTHHVRRAVIDRDFDYDLSTLEEARAQFAMALQNASEAVLAQLTEQAEISFKENQGLPCSWGLKAIGGELTYYQ